MPSPEVSLAARIYHSADARDILLGEHREEACAGPPARIEAVLDGMFEAREGTAKVRWIPYIDRMIAYSAASLAESVGSLLFSIGERLRGTARTSRGVGGIGPSR